MRPCMLSPEQYYAWQRSLKERSDSRSGRHGKSLQKKDKKEKDAKKSTRHAHRTVSRGDSLSDISESPRVFVKRQRV